jgi:hypothetical protein
MPPQQGQNLLDFGDGLFDFRTHLSSSYAAPRLAEAAGRINPQAGRTPGIAAPRIRFTVEKEAAGC